MLKDKMKIPADLAAALSAGSAANQLFAALPTSHKMEYVRWIEEAKKPETRKRRIEETIKRLCMS